VPHLSDSQDPAVEILRLGGLAKAAMLMFKGMEVQLDHDLMHMHMRALVKVPFLKVIIISASAYFVMMIRSLQRMHQHQHAFVSKNHGLLEPTEGSN
jgi:hypothetical protein